MKKIAATVLALVMAASMFGFANAASPSINADNIVTPGVELDVEVEKDLEEMPVSMGDIRDVIENTQTAPQEMETAYEEDETGFSIRLKRLKVDSDQVDRMRDIALFIEQLPVNIVTGEEIQTGAYMMDEIYFLEVENYDASIGDVAAVFEFVTEYEEDAILMAMVNAVPADAVHEAVEANEAAWYCLKGAAVGEEVHITMPQNVLEAAAADENAIFALVRVQLPEAEN